MSRFFYVHFDGDVPRRIEQEYNKMLRQEKYQEERDAECRVQSVGFDELQEMIPDPASLPMSETEAENKAIHDARLKFLPAALEMLRLEYPEGYALIRDYYLGDEKVSMFFLMEKYGLTRPVVKYRLRLAREKLKAFIIAHENTD